jgi:hypothetical protein
MAKTWDEIRGVRYSLLTPPPEWPSNVRPISMEATFPVMPEWATLSSICDVPANERSEDWDCSWLARVKDRLDLDKEQRAALQSAILLALLPPASMLAVGSAELTTDNASVLNLDHSAVEVTHRNFLTTEAA